MKGRAHQSIHRGSRKDRMGILFEREDIEIVNRRNEPDVGSKRRDHQIEWEEMDETTHRINNNRTYRRMVLSLS